MSRALPKYNQRRVAIIGGAATAAVIGRNYIAKLKRLFVRKAPRK